MFHFDARLDVQLDPNDILREYGLERGGRVQRFIDQKVISGCKPYIPASPRRILANSAQALTEIGSGIVIWETPYARYQYYGHVMTDELGRTWVGKGEKKPIVHEDWPLTYDTSQNQLAGSHWFERAKADHLTEWLDEARKVMIQGG